MSGGGYGPRPGGQPPRGYPPQYGAPHETFVFANQNAPRETSLTRVTVPIVLVISFGGFLVLATYLATSQFSDIKHAIAALSGKIESLTGELSGRVGRVEQEQSEARREQWSKRDHEVWCAKAERANQRIGWTCSDSGNPIERYASPQVHGWEARKRP